MEDKHDLLIRYADYFRRAEEADGIAASTHDAEARRSFELVALGWRQLAQRVKRLMERGL